MLGRIYTNIKTFNTLQFIELHRIDDYVKDINTPTLLIGKKELMDRGNELSVLNRQIDTNLFWTYTKMEKRNIHEEDIKTFYDLVFKKLCKNIKYSNISIYTMRYTLFKKMVNILLDDNIYKCIYIQKNHVYVYYSDKIIGFSIDEIKYIGIDINKVMTLLTKTKNCDIITNNNFIKNEVKNYLINKEYLTPYLYFIEKNA
jgi:hypothetical protein